jgi:23S rRNA pseudoU1915 N3-methylase RlmH
MALSKEELAELQALEVEESKAAEAQADAELRQRLEAKRMRKRLAKPGFEHGKDFAVVETTTGLVVAIRRPSEVEVEALAESKDEARAGVEKFVLSLLIEPSKEIVGEHFARYCNLAPAFQPVITSMMGELRKEEAKK